MVALNSTKPKFALGRVVATPGAMAALAESRQTPQEFLRRHAAGDWGDVSAADAEANDESLTGGDRLLSSYCTFGDSKIWIITEADRSATLPTPNMFPISRISRSSN